MSVLLNGALGMACAMIGLIFLRFWKSSRDPFFLYFAVSFWIQGAQWLYSGATASASEFSPYLYLPRLLAYSLIAVAILRKNYGKIGRDGGPRR